MKNAYRFIGFALVVIASAYFIGFAVQNGSQLPPEIFTRQVLLTLAVTPFGYAITFALTGIAWHLLLSDSGEPSRLPRVLSILLVSQFAKYLPGNIGHHVGRVFMARNAGLASGPVIFTMTVEAVGAILAAVGIALAALAINGSFLPEDAVELPGPIYLLLLLLLITLVPTAATLLLRRLPARHTEKLLGIGSIRVPALQTLFASYALYIANFLIIGAILVFLTAAITGETTNHFWLLTGVFAVAQVAGFVTPGAPGGLGVREAILIAALDPIYGAGIALSLSVGLRVITTLGDGLGFLAGLGLARSLGLKSN